MPTAETAVLPARQPVPGTTPPPKAPCSSRRDTLSTTTAACAPAAVVDRAEEPGWTVTRRGRGEHMSWLAAILARFDEALEWPEGTMFDAALDWPVEPECDLPGGA